MEDTGHPGTGTSEDPGPQPAISVVLPVRNGMPWIRDQLDALSHQDVEGTWEVVVVDNGSTDDTVQFVESWMVGHESVQLVDGAALPGAAAARNAGAHAATGAILAFCDADDVVETDWLTAIASALDRFDVVSGVADVWSLQGRERGDRAPVTSINPFEFLPHAGSRNLAMRRSTFDAVDGFDPTFLTHEDVDLSWRLQLRGFTLGTADDAVVAGRYREGFAATFRQRFRYGRFAPALYARYRSAGMAWSPAEAVKSWAWIVCSAPLLVQESRRLWWAQNAGLRLGRLVGSIDQRVLFF